MSKTKKNKKETEIEENIDEVVNESEEIKSENLEDCEIIENKEETEEIKNRLIRLQADFENYKKRILKEKQDIVKYSLEGVIGELLPVIDNFDRALENEGNENKEFLEGIKMINNQLQEVLEKNGLKKIEALEKTFDPNYHNAISQLDSEDKEKDIVLQVYQEGYTLNDKVIRPSMVVVSK